MHARIMSTGTYLPKRQVENSFFSLKKSYSKNLDDLFDGCTLRHHASPEETCAAMGAQAARQALERAGMKPTDISYILSTSTVPDNLFPSDGLLVSKALGIGHAPCMDINMACGTFGSMLLTANQLIEAGRAENVLILTMTNWISRVIDTDRNYSCLGDGAAAVIVGPSETKSLISYREESHPEWFQGTYVPIDWKSRSIGNVTFTTDDAFREFNTQGTAVKPLHKAMSVAMEQGEQAKWFIPHQPGRRMTSAWGHSLGFSDSKILTTSEFTGNMAAVNVPHIIDHFTNSRQILRGDVLALFTPGAGVYICGIVWKY